MIPAASGFRASAGVTKGEGWPIHGQGDGASSRSSRGSLGSWDLSATLDAANLRELGYGG